MATDPVLVGGFSNGISVRTAVVASMGRSATGEDGNMAYVSPDAPRGTGLLDDVAKQIIEHLQRDGRRSYAAIAKSVGLSEAAVRQRVQRMIDSGIMQIVAVTDPMQVGFRRQAMVGVKVSGDITAVTDALTALPEADYVLTTAGSFDVLVEVVAEDDGQLLDLLTNRIRTIPGVVSTETFVYLKLNKQHYDWGTR